MTMSTALRDPIFLTYVGIIIALLGAAVLALRVLRARGKDVTSAEASLRGWLIMIPVIIGAIFLGREAVIIGVALLAIFGFKEFAKATGLYADWWLTGVAYVAISSIAVIALMTDPRTAQTGWYGMFMALPVYVIAVILLVPIIRNRAKGQLQAVSLAILGFVYFGWMLSHLSFIANLPQAYGYLLFLLFAAFTVGKMFGKRKLREAISPNKTIGGSLGAIAVSLLVPWLLWFSFDNFSATELILTGLIVGIGGQMGDLVLSYIKRAIGIKDMGAIITGHGGILDRVDSMIFVAQLFFHMVRWFHGAP